MGFLILSLMFTLLFVSGTWIPCSAQYDYREVLQKSLLFYEAQRSGYLPADNRITWRGDSGLTDGQDRGIDLTGGWYDAGDHMKQGFPTAFSLTLLSWGLWEYRDAYQLAGQLYTGLEGIKWGLNYLIKCHDSDTVFFAQVGDSESETSYWNRPENMTGSRPAVEINEEKPGSDMAGEGAAAFAAGSLAFRGIDDAYSNILLDHARRLYNFSYTYRGLYSDHMPSEGYTSSGYQDELAWGAIWLYHATGEQQYLNYANEFYSARVVWSFYWDLKSPGVQVLMYKATQQYRYKNNITSFMNNWFPGGDVIYTPRGLAWRAEFGALRHAANVAALALLAATSDVIIPDPDFDDSREWARNQIHYMLGDTGRSFVQGFGVNPPERSRHKAASCDPDFSVPCGWDDSNSPDPNPSPLIGALVSGPNSTDGYVDDRIFARNGVAPDYNAGFQTAIAGLIQLDEIPQKLG